jgi:hypothetical protein
MDIPLSIVEIVYQAIQEAIVEQDPYSLQMEEVCAIL